MKEEYRGQGSVYNASRNLGNLVSGALTGVTGHLVGNLAQITAMVGSTYTNLWRAETIGPYAKTFGSLVALAGIPMVAAAAVVASPFMGLSEAVGATVNESSEADAYERLAQDTTPGIADKLTGSADAPRTVVGKAIQNMTEFGDRKLAPGEQPWDIPVDKIFQGALDGLEFLMVQVPVQACKLTKEVIVETARFVQKYGPKLAGATLSGVTSALIAGPAGLMIGSAVGVTLAAQDIKAAVTDKDLSLASRLGGIARTLAYIPVGPVMAVIALRDNFARSFVEGWDGHPIEAIKTTGIALLEQAKQALHGHQGDH